MLLGLFGIHNFYAGYLGKGATQLAITVLFGWLFGLGLMITAIWVLVELFTVKIDAAGQEMT